MSSFALVEFTQVKGHIRFYKLEVNGICPLDEFWAEIRAQSNLAKQLNKAIAIMELIALKHLLPEEKYKKISDSGEKVKEYEVKTKDLRIYLFRLPDGAIVVLGGKKSTQKRDINRFKNLKEEYLNTL